MKIYQQHVCILYLEVQDKLVLQSTFYSSLLYIVKHNLNPIFLAAMQNREGINKQEKA